MNERIGKIALLGASVLALAASPAVKKTMEWQGAFCAAGGPARVVAQTPSEWIGLWRKIGNAPPAADMGKFTAVAVFLGTRTTGGYGVSFEPPRKKGKATVVPFMERRPAPGGFAIEVLTHPYHVRLFPKIRGPVLVEETRTKLKRREPKRTEKKRKGTQKTKGKNSPGLQR